MQLGFNTQPLEVKVARGLFHDNNIQQVEVWSHFLECFMQIVSQLYPLFMISSVTRWYSWWTCIVQQKITQVLKLAQYTFEEIPH